MAKQQRMILARRWKTPKTIIGLFCIEFCYTVAALALFGIADPDLYRTRLWQDGSNAGYNSNPNEVLYAAANYVTLKIPMIWSQLYVSILSTKAGRY